MSRTLGKAIHQCYVYPDFDAALARFAGGGIGPFYVMHVPEGVGRFRGVEYEHAMSIAFFHTGDMCVEVITPNGPQTNAYSDFLKRNPAGGLHHIAYHSDDFAASLAAMEAAGTPLRVVQEFYNPETGHIFEIYCEPVGVENPILFQLLGHGFDDWFEAMRREAEEWDGSEPIRDGMAMMLEAKAQAGG